MADWKDSGNECYERFVIKARLVGKWLGMA